MKNEQVDNGIHSTRAMDMGIVPAELPGFVCSINKYQYSGRSAEKDIGHTYSYFLLVCNCCYIPLDLLYILLGSLGTRPSSLA